MSTVTPSRSPWLLRIRERNQQISHISTKEPHDSFSVKWVSEGNKFVTLYSAVLAQGNCNHSWRRSTQGQHEMLYAHHKTLPLSVESVNICLRRYSGLSTGLNKYRRGFHSCKPHTRTNCRLVVNCPNPFTRSNLLLAVYWEYRVMRNGRFCTATWLTATTYVWRAGFGTDRGVSARCRGWLQRTR